MKLVLESPSKKQKSTSIFPTNIEDYSWEDDKILRTESFYTGEDRLELAYQDMGSLSNWKVNLFGSDKHM